VITPQRCSGMACVHSFTCTPC